MPTADMYLLDNLDDGGQVLKANDTWKGCVVDVDHQFLFRWKDGASSLVHGQPEGWLFGLYHYKDSACLVWPVDLVDLQGISG